MIELTAQYLAEQGLSANFPERFWKKVFILTYDRGCWLWIAGKRGHYGYGGINCTDDPHNAISAHKASWILHYGPIPEGMCVLHWCDNPPCVRPDHLWLGTHAENMADMVKKGRGRGLQGESHNMAKLTQSQADQIRELYDRSIKNGAKLAREFGVSRHAIWCIVHGKTWATR
jgi:hypothetical protein